MARVRTMPSPAACPPHSQSDCPRPASSHIHPQEPHTRYILADVMHKSAFSKSCARSITASATYSESHPSASSAAHDRRKITLSAHKGTGPCRFNTNPSASNRFRSTRPILKPRSPAAAIAGGLRALWRRRPCRALHRPHAQSARPTRAPACSPRPVIRAACILPAWCAASSGSSPAPSSNRCSLQFELLQKVYGAKALERMHLRTSRVRAFSRRQSLPAHRGHLPAQPARSRLGLRAISVARGSRTIFRRGAQAFSPAPLHLRSRARPELSPAAFTPR